MRVAPQSSPPGADVRIILVDGRQPVSGGIVEYACTIENHERVGHHKNRVRWVAVHRRKSVFEIIRLTDGERLNADIESFGCVSRSLISQGHAKIALIP